MRQGSCCWAAAGRALSELIDAPPPFSCEAACGSSSREAAARVQVSVTAGRTGVKIRNWTFSFFNGDTSSNAGKMSCYF